MATYLEPFDSTNELFDEAIIEANLKQYLNVVIVADNKAKKIFHVAKASPIHKHRTGDDVIITLNEFVFDQLTDEQRTIIISDSLSRISFDSEKDKVTIVQPDFTANRMILSKFGVDVCVLLDDTIKLIYAQEKDKKSQEDKE